MDSANPKIQLKVQVWIHRLGPDGEMSVLLLRMIPSRGAGWQPVTGSVERDEALAAAADREASEETGGRFKGPAAPIGYEFTFDGRWGAARETVFALESASEFTPRLDPKEHDDFRWVKPEEASRLLRFDSNRVALDRLLNWIASRGRSQT